MAETTNVPFTVMGPLQLPPQPDIRMFTYDAQTNHLAYNAALKAWEKVCTHLIDTHADIVRSSDFWKVT